MADIRRISTLTVDTTVTSADQIVINKKIGAEFVTSVISPTNLGPQLGPFIALGDLSGVTISGTVANGSVLEWNGTSWIPVTNLGNYVLTAGGHMTGDLTLGPNSSVNTITLDASSGSVTASSFIGDGSQVKSIVTISVSAPTVNVANGDLWWNSTNGILYVYYNDGNSQQWVDAMPDFSADSTSITSITNALTAVHTAASDNSTNLAGMKAALVSALSAFSS